VTPMVAQGIHHQKPTGTSPSMLALPFPPPFSCRVSFTTSDPELDVRRILGTGVSVEWRSNLNTHSWRP